MAKLDLSKLPQINRRLMYKIMVIYREHDYLEKWKRFGGPARMMKLSAFNLKHHLDRLESGEFDFQETNRITKSENRTTRRHCIPEVEMGEQKPIVGFCSTHPKTPAVATERRIDEKLSQIKRFCRECWEHHKYTTLGLRSAPSFRGASFIGHGYAPAKASKPTLKKIVRQLLFSLILLICGCASNDTWTRSNYNQWVLENRMASQYGTVEGFAMLGNPQRDLDYDTWLSQLPIQTTPYFYDSFYYQNSPTLIYNFGTRRRR